MLRVMLLIGIEVERWLLVVEHGCLNVFDRWGRVKDRWEGPFWSTEGQGDHEGLLLLWREVGRWLLGVEGRWVEVFDGWE